MTLVDSGTVKRGRLRLRFCVGKSLSLYYCSFNMKLCSWGDLVLLTSVSLQRTKPPALWMIYIHGKWQLEQESRDVILSQTGNKASFLTPPKQSAYQHRTRGRTVISQYVIGAKQGMIGRNLWKFTGKYAENKNGLKPAGAIPYIYIAQWH